MSERRLAQRRRGKDIQSLGVVAGIPDVILIHGGRVFGLELKAESGRLSPIQIATQERMRAAGAIVAQPPASMPRLPSSPHGVYCAPTFQAKPAKAFQKLRDDVAGAGALTAVTREQTRVTRTT